MNGARIPKRNGFRARVVGGRDFEALPFNAFFPLSLLGRLDPDSAATGDEWPGVRVGDLIPAAALGGLYDDVGRWEGEEEEEEEMKEEDEEAGDAEPGESPSGDEAKANTSPGFRESSNSSTSAGNPGEAAPEDTPCFVLIPIARDASGVVQPGPEILSATLPADTPLLDELRVKDSAGVDEETEDDDECEEDRVEARRVARMKNWLQVGHLYHELCRAFANGEVRNGHARITVRLCNWLRHYLEEELHVWVPFSTWDMLATMGQFRSRFHSDAAFKDFLAVLRGRALYHWPQFQPLYPGVDVIPCP
jgi:hypothetical protein